MHCGRDHGSTRAPSQICAEIGGEIESNCGVSERFHLSSEKHVKDAILVLVLSSWSPRRLLPFSRREKRCARGLIGKPCRQTDFTPRGDK
jgi:hypothetical protein